MVPTDDGEGTDERDCYLAFTDGNSIVVKHPKKDDEIDVTIAFDRIDGLIYERAKFISRSACLFSFQVMVTRSRMARVEPRDLGIARSVDDLLGLVEQASADNAGRLVLFRGQTELHGTIRSGRARGRRVVREVEIAWSRLAARMLGVQMDEAPEARFAQALLQHYGLPTYFVDLTSHPSVAAWFAVHKFEAKRCLWAGSEIRSFTQVVYRRLTDGYGYVLVLALPEAQRLAEDNQLFCLSQLPREVLRPHRQLGWLFHDGAGATHDINASCVGAIRVDRGAFQVEALTQEGLFPSPSLDAAYRDLLGYPWVQTPTIYMSPEPSDVSAGKMADEEFQKATERWCFGHRALDTLEYFENDDGYDHKWDDITLYESHPVRAWRGWRFDLSSRNPDWHGDIAESVKITLSDHAREILEHASPDTECAWPDVDSDDTFFSFSQMGHDKVIDNAPPYRGVWLNRSGDRIVETVTEADEDVLTLGPGLAYRLTEGRLTPDTAPGTCTCGNIESHLERVSAMLRLSHFVATGDITFVPHPAFLPRWYVAV